MYEGKVLMDTKIMMCNRLQLILTAWWTADGTSKDEEARMGAYEPQIVN